MAQITSEMVKTLRERTSAGMMDCKKALVESDGDMEKAVDWLREKGLSQAAKKADRIAAEGVVADYCSDNHGVAVVLEVNCETDFVAKTDNFKEFANKVAKHVAMANPADVDQLMTQSFVDEPSKTIADLLSEATVAIGEKLSLRRFARYETTGVAETYIHLGGKIGVVVEVAVDAAHRGSDKVKEVAHDLCLQIAAAKPECVRREEVDASALEKEKEILRAQALNEGKPAVIVDKMVEGRIQKYYKEVCLLEQPYVRDPDLSVQKLLDNVGAELGTKLDVVRYARFERGEGIEKRKDNFAEEIAAQMNRA